MKAIKFLLVLLLVMLGTTAFAQDVVVTKTDGTTDVIENADSVVYDVQDYGYYGWIDTNTAKKSLEFTSAMFNKHLTNNLPLVLIDASEFVGKYFIIALPSSNKPNAAFESSFGNAPLKIQTGTEWEVNNKVNINNKEYYVFIITTPIGTTTTKLTITKS